MADGAKSGSWWKKGLKWFFKAAVFGAALWFGAVLAEEFLFYGVMHGADPVSSELAHLSKEFTAPLVSWFSDAVGGVEGLSGFESFLKGVHEFFGVEGTFETPLLTEDVLDLEIDGW